MRARSFAIILISCLLAACISHEGTYSPSCIAFAGNTIELSDGQFVWEKFTDALVLDDDGNVVDQFPGYPMRGSYRIEGQTVHMVSVAGEALPDMHLHQREDGQYLLTTEQFEALEQTAEVAECALVLGGHRRD